MANPHLAGRPPNRPAHDPLGIDLRQLPALLASAPHRPMFLAGACAVLVSMLWWAAYLTYVYLGRPFPMPPGPLPPGWAHAVLIQYGLFPPFMFGFLLTVFPRWTGQPLLTRKHYIPVFIGLFGGYLLAHVGLLGHRIPFIAGLVLMVAGWAMGLWALGGVLIGNRARDQHARSTYIALVAGWLGLSCFMVFLAGGSAMWVMASIKIGTLAFLLPVYFTVCHRMVPFFSANIVGPGYRLVRPTWTLPVMWALLLVHLVLELMHQYTWLWLVDIPLTLFFLAHWFMWQPWKCMRPGLLAVLHIALAWLPIAFALYALQSIVFALGGGFILGRAPIHALAIGFFGSMLVAMVTRVTQGHSGRPLQMGATAWFAFTLLQLVAVLRIAAEAGGNGQGWLAAGAVLWLVAFTPWVLRGLWIYITPRADGRPG